MKITKTGSYNPAQPSPTKCGRMVAPIANSAAAGDGKTNHKLLKATAAAPMKFDGEAMSFDSGGKKPRNAS